MNGDKSDVVYNEEKVLSYRKSKRFSSGADIGGQKSIIRSSRDSAAEIGIPTLHYLSPLRSTLDDLRKSVASIERKVKENKKTIVKSSLDGSMDERDISDATRKANIDFNYVTEQVYRMLERKIIIEKERRGL
jgi:hypothetical protein